MAKSKALFKELVSAIRLPESRDESESLAYSILEKEFGWSVTDVLSDKDADADWDRLNQILERLNHHEPLQYILGEAHFFSRKFLVDPSVLIPRPETEILIEEALRMCPYPGSPGLRVLDVGTGSGCIAVTLAKELPIAEVHAVDISAGALLTAAENARINEASVSFCRHDILQGAPPINDVSLLVSNPPYVTESERHLMKENVTAHEPRLALYVPDDDPLKYYKAICRIAKSAVRRDGAIIVEINERFGQDVAELFTNEGLRSVSVLKDLAGKDRVVSALV